MLRYIIILNEPWVKVVMFILHLKQQFYFVVFFFCVDFAKTWLRSDSFVFSLSNGENKVRPINLLRKSTLIDSRNQYCFNDIHQLCNEMHFMKLFGWKLANGMELHRTNCQTLMIYAIKFFIG